jgi:hypothetical protein
VSTTVTVTPLDNSTGSNRAGRSKAASVTPSAPAPTGLAVTAWTYTSVTLGWANPAIATHASAALVVERAVGAGAFVEVSQSFGIDGSPLPTTFTDSTVQPLTNYRYRVKVNGLVYATGYSGEVRPAIGRDAYSTTAAYSQTKSGCNIYLGNPDGPNVPSGQGIVLNLMTVDVACTFATGLLSGTATRTVGLHSNGTDNWPFGVNIGSKANPWQDAFGWGQSSPNGVQGLNVNGSGWGNNPGSSFRVAGTITVSGTQTTNYPAVPNGYW